MPFSHVDFTPPGSKYGIGALNCYMPNSSELINFMDWIYTVLPSNNFFDDFAKVITNPADCIVDCHLAYCAGEQGSSTSQIIFGPFKSPVSAHNISSYTSSIDCGTKHINPIHNNYGDYGPYTSAVLYLPLIGMVELPIDSIMDRDVKIVYNGDCVTGGLLVEIFTNGDGSILPSELIAAIPGTCTVPLPLYSNNGLQNFLNGALSVGGVVLAGVATGGIGAGVAGAAGVGLSAAGMTAGTLGALPDSSRGGLIGNISGSASLVGSALPQLTLTTKVEYPFGVAGYGFPTHRYDYIRSFPSGYARFSSVRMLSAFSYSTNDGQIAITKEEMEELRSVLTGPNGVVLPSSW